MPVIETKQLSKTYKAKVKEAGLRASFRALAKPEYRQVEAVKQVSFQVEKGERLAFIGPNGAGKSTTIKMLTGILYPTGGEMSVLGLNPSKQRQQLAYRIGTVFGQKSQLWFHLPPMDSFLLLGAIYDIPDKALKVQIDEMVTRFELAELLKTPVRKLSLGQRIRCEVAASLLHNPEILFLDEPTIGLDVIVKEQIRDRILEMNRERGTTVFLTSHDAGDIEKLCQRAIVIDHGQIVLDQPVDTLKKDHFSHKIVIVQFDAIGDFVCPDGVEVLEKNEAGARFLADTKYVEIDDVMRWLVSQGKVTDITVEDPPMEQVIAKIFRREGGA